MKKRTTIKWGLMCILSLALMSTGFANQALTYNIPSENYKLKYFKTFKPGKAVVLTVTVSANTGYEITERKVTSLPDNVTNTGIFTLTVPATMPENSYTCKFNGKYKRVNTDPNGGGGGGNEEEKTWKVNSKFVINKCDHEDSGTEDYDPPGDFKTVPSKQPMKTYKISVTPKDPNRMNKVNAQIYHPQAGWIKYWKSWVGSTIMKSRNRFQDCPKCEDHCIRWRRWMDKGVLTMKYYITMPKWEEAAQAGVDAKAEWDKFYDALLKHEEGHEKVLTDYFAGDGKTAFEAFGKKKYWGEAHDSIRAWNLATLKYDAPLLAILNAHKQLQDVYDTTTNHGKNQAAIGGDNVVTPDGMVPTWDPE